MLYLEPRLLLSRTAFSSTLPAKKGVLCANNKESLKFQNSVRRPEFSKFAKVLRKTDSTLNKCLLLPVVHMGLGRRGVAP